MVNSIGSYQLKNSTLDHLIHFIFSEFNRVLSVLKNSIPHHLIYQVLSVLKNSILHHLIHRVLLVLKNSILHHLIHCIFSEFNQVLSVLKNSTLHHLIHCIFSEFKWSYQFWKTQFSISFEKFNSPSLNPSGLINFEKLNSVSPNPLHFWWIQAGLISWKTQLSIT